MRLASCTHTPLTSLLYDSVLATGVSELLHYYPLPPQNGEVEVRTTVRAKGSPRRSECRAPSLELLRKMKSLQNTLQRDDLSWD